MYQYNGFGYRFASDVRLSIPALNGTVTLDRPREKIHVCRHETKEKPPERSGGNLRMLDFFRIYNEEVGFFDIERGSSVDIYPFEGVDDPILEMWLLGCVMAVLLHQRGFVILHACALQVNGQNVALIGESGMGKSTMTAAMLAQGYEFIVDDLVAIDVSGPQPMILPGFPMLKLTEEIATRFGFDLDSSLGRHPYKGKLFFHAQPVSDDPLPLHHLLFLDRMDEPGMEFRRLSSREAFFEAVKNTLPTRWGCPSDRRHFELCSALGAQLPFTVFRRNFDLDKISSQVHAVADYLGGAPGNLS